MLTPADIAPDVRNVLATANKGKGKEPHYLTAYQILDRLPALVRDQLIVEKGLPGSGAGVYHAAATVVRHALLHHLRGEVEYTYFDNVGATFEVAGHQIRGGNSVCGLYKLRPSEDSDV